MTLSSRRPGDSVHDEGETHSDADAAYSIIPAAGYHFLTPVFDLLAASVGVGRRFREHVMTDAGIANGTRVMDIGCGSGLLTLAISERYPACSVVGVDADARILERARRRAQAARTSAIEFVHAPAEKTGLAASSFDVALSTLVFHHLPLEAKARAAIEIARLLRPGGTFLLADIRPLRPQRRHLQPAERLDPGLGFRSNSPEALSRFLASAGFGVNAICPPPAWALRPWLFALRGVKQATA